MTAITQSNASNAYANVRGAIQDLMEFNGEDDRDDVLYAAYKLNSVLRTVQENYRSWSKDTIREFVLSQHDPLRFIKVKSENLYAMVRTIQQEMVVQFSRQEDGRISHAVLSA